MVPSFSFFRGQDSDSSLQINPRDFLDSRVGTGTFHWSGYPGSPGLIQKYGEVENGCFEKKGEEGVSSYFIRIRWMNTILDCPNVRADFFDRERAGEEHFVKFGSRVLAKSRGKRVWGNGLLRDLIQEPDPPIHSFVIPIYPRTTHISPPLPA